MPEGRVIAQAPGAGIEVVLGTPVDLVISLGPATVPAPIGSPLLPGQTRPDQAIAPADYHQVPNPEAFQGPGSHPIALKIRPTNPMFRLSLKPMKINHLPQEVHR